MDIIKKLIKKDNFSTTEVLIADYIINNLDNVIYITIRDLALATFTSNSAVLRTIKKVYDGSFSDFKVTIALALKSLSNPTYNHNTLQKGDTVQSILEKITALEIEAIAETKTLLDVQQLERVFQLNHKIDKIYLYVEAISGNLANEIKYLMARFGKNVEIIQEDDVVILDKALNHSQSIALFIVLRYESKELTKKVRLNYERYIPTVYISSFYNIEAAPYCTEYIHIHHGIPYSEMAPFIHATSIRYVINLIVSFIIVNDFDYCQDQLKAYIEMMKT